MTYDPSGKWILAADLGADKVFLYTLSKDGELEHHLELAINFPPGSGPRHIDFHPNEHFFFVVCELNATIMSFSWNSDTGTAEAVS